MDLHGYWDVYRRRRKQFLGSSTIADIDIEVIIILLRSQLYPTDGVTNGKILKHPENIEALPSPRIVVWGKRVGDYYHFVTHGTPDAC